VKPQSQIPVLVVIKLVHTAIWRFFAGCIAAIPAAAAQNRSRCPLTDPASRYTEERTDNFDIYLPLWLARYNKTIFGTIFAAGDLFWLRRWLISGR